MQTCCSTADQVEPGRLCRCPGGLDPEPPPQSKKKGVIAEELAQVAQHVQTRNFADFILFLLIAVFGMSTVLLYPRAADFLAEDALYTLMPRCTSGSGQKHTSNNHFISMKLATAREDRLMRQE